VWLHHATWLVCEVRCLECNAEGKGFLAGVWSALQRPQQRTLGEGLYAGQLIRLEPSYACEEL